VRSRQILSLAIGDFLHRLPGRKVLTRCVALSSADCKGERERERVCVCVCVFVYVCKSVCARDWRVCACVREYVHISVRTRGGERERVCVCSCAHV